MSRLLISSSIALSALGLVRPLYAQGEPAASVSTEATAPEAVAPVAPEPKRVAPEPPANADAAITPPAPPIAPLTRVEGTPNPTTQDSEPGTAGVHQGVFFIRDRKDVFRL